MNILQVIYQPLDYYSSIKSKVYGENRYCPICNRKLSIYNPNKECYVCIRKGGAIEKIRYKYLVERI